MVRTIGSLERELDSMNSTLLRLTYLEYARDFVAHFHASLLGRDAPNVHHDVAMEGLTERIHQHNTFHRDGNVLNIPVGTTNRQLLTVSDFDTRLQPATHLASMSQKGCPYLASVWGTTYWEDIGERIEEWSKWSFFLDRAKLDELLLDPAGVPHALAVELDKPMQDKMSVERILNMFNYMIMIHAAEDAKEADIDMFASHGGVWDASRAIIGVAKYMLKLASSGVSPFVGTLRAIFMRYCSAESKRGPRGSPMCNFLRVRLQARTTSGTVSYRRSEIRSDSRPQGAVL
jgi:hypothetical protein